VSSRVALQPTSFREAKQVALLLGTLRAGLDAAAPLARLPLPATLFTARALGVLLRPDDPFYPHINRFLLQRPAIDVGDMPLFYGLFFSPSVAYRAERLWMLRLLAAGLQTSQVRVWRVRVRLAVRPRLSRARGGGAGLSALQAPTRA
jgi:hypothetical protein